MPRIWGYHEHGAARHREVGEFGAAQEVLVGLRPRRANTPASSNPRGGRTATNRDFAGATPGGSGRPAVGPRLPDTEGAGDDEARSI
jgi:hypothetical protein